MSKVVVTGGAGFIGSNLVQKLLQDGHEITVVDDLSTGLESNLDFSKVKLEILSLEDEQGLKKALFGAEVIFHFGARGSVPRSIKNPIATHSVNATGTLNVLNSARGSGAHVIFSSSSSVYGRNLALPKDELMWMSPLTPYAASKLAAEAYVQAYGASYQVPVTLLRFFNVFGPKQRPDHAYAAVIPKWIWLAMQDKPIEVFGDGTQSRDFTYVESVVDVAISSMNRKVFTEGAVNLAFGNRITLNEVLELMEKEFPKLKVNFVEMRNGDVKESQNQPKLLNTLFPEIEPKPFKTAFLETVVWLREFGETIANGPEVLD